MKDFKNLKQQKLVNKNKVYINRHINLVHLIPTMEHSLLKLIKKKASTCGSFIFTVAIR